MRELEEAGGEELMSMEEEAKVYEAWSAWRERGRCSNDAVYRFWKQHCFGWNLGFFFLRISGLVSFLNPVC